MRLDFTRIEFEDALEHVVLDAVDAETLEIEVEPSAPVVVLDSEPPRGWHHVDHDAAD